MANTIAPAQLTRAIDACADEITILSLDCFDTLLWRSTHSPSDLFSELQCGSRVRVWSESLQREFNRRALGRDEVTLSEIHARAYPDADQAHRDQRMQEELLAEHSHCFGFAATTALIRKAKQRGLQVIVVSDTYLNAQQLRSLIAHAAGESIAELIDSIFCSSDFGCNKASGLFRHVLRELKVTPRTILHIGDNFTADYSAALDAGIRAMHIQQFPDELTQRFRLEAAAGLIMDPRFRSTKPVIQLHRAPLAAGWDAQASAAARVGYGSIGPILVAYSYWLQEQLMHLACDRGSATIRPLFLMRDGYLPFQVFNQATSNQQWNARTVDLSRFCAYSASFTDEKSILEYLTELGGTLRYDVMSKQLLFTDDEAAELAQAAEGANPIQAYTERILQPGNRRKIVSRSAAFADRLCRYLEDHAQVQAGQTLVFCDLGYAGTIQTRLAPVLEERLKVQVVGRYLLLRDMPAWRQDKAALLGPDHYDHRALDSLAAYIAIVEQLCTAETASTVDYSHDGTPIRKRSDQKAHQSKHRQVAQRACMNYAQNWADAFERLPNAADTDGHRSTALQVISRLMFTPSTEETELFAGFEHDLNLGTQDSVTLFDPKSARDGLLRSGLFYTNNNPSQYLPAEVRDAGLELSLNVLLLRRFSPDLRFPDFHGSTLSLPIMIADERRMAPGEVHAIPTREGYFSASIPIGDSRLSIGLKFGELFDWVQIHCIESLPVRKMLVEGEEEHRRDLRSSLILEEIHEHGNGLLQCMSKTGFALIPAPPRQSDEPMVLNIVFRPIAYRHSAAESEANTPVEVPSTQLATNDL